MNNGTHDMMMKSEGCVTFNPTRQNCTTCGKQRCNSAETDLILTEINRVDGETFGETKIDNLSPPGSVPLQCCAMVSVCGHGASHSSPRLSFL